MLCFPLPSVAINSSSDSQTQSACQRAWLLPVNLELDSLVAAGFLATGRCIQTVTLSGNLLPPASFARGEGGAKDFFFFFF